MVYLHWIVPTKGVLPNVCGSRKSIKEGQRPQRAVEVSWKNTVYGYGSMIIYMAKVMKNFEEVLSISFTDSFPVQV
jgi:hypothetical protein